jgi:hypothetical protein
MTIDKRVQAIIERSKSFDFQLRGLYLRAGGKHVMCELIFILAIIISDRFEDEGSQDGSFVRIKKRRLSERGAFG